MSTNESKAFDPKETPLEGLPIVVYDLEIKEPIDGERIKWTSYSEMGISVGVSFDYRTSEYRVFLDDNMGELMEQLMSADLVVGFNQIGFDNKLMQANGFIGQFSNYDILLESRHAMGFRPGDPFPKGMKLDNHLEAMFGKEWMKTGHGELAPELWQKGKKGAVISYCLADVKRTCMVFDNIWKKGTVTTAAHGTKAMRHPSEFMRRI